MEELLKQLIEYVGEGDYTIEQDSFLLTLIEDALEEVCEAMYPYGFPPEDEEKVKDRALKRYKSKIRKIAQYHYDKVGAEGVLSISENGVSTSYENAGTPSSYLRGIIPVAKIVK